MFFPEGHVRMFLYGQTVNMRLSFDGPYALAKHVMPQDPLFGILFAFINCRAALIRVLYFDRSGRPTTASSKRSTDRYVMNALTTTGLPTSPRSRPSWRHGALTTMRFDLTWLSKNKPGRPSLGAQFLEDLKQAIVRLDS